jgi:transcriptional regulator with XRE-family HTH domain/mannose-6-phosphate isomerase-like protein (cupin superfamily)
VAPSASVAHAPAADGAGQLAAIGATIRGLRRTQGLSLRELARLTGFSIGFLSLVERGQSSISLTSLHTVGKALGVEMSAFFPARREEPEAPAVPHVTRLSGDGRLSTDSAHAYKLLGGRGFNRTLEPVHVTVAPFDDTRDAYAHEGEEFAFVLSGRIVFIVDGVEYRLEAGESIHFQSTIPHTFFNETDEPAEALWVLTTRLF